MNNKRLLAVAKFIEKDDKVIDVGCDHGYLGIYLKKHDLCDDLLLTDVSQNALNVAIANISKAYLDIKTFNTDGLENIDLNKYNTVSICGMGTHTMLDILSILKNNNSINKLLLQSNNNLDILREEVIKLGFYLDDEITLKENGKYYVICKFLKGNKKIDEITIKYGILKEDKIDYYNYLIDSYKSYLKDIKNESDIKKINDSINILNSLLEKCR